MLVTDFIFFIPVASCIRSAKVSNALQWLQISEALIAINVSSLGLYIIKYVESDKIFANKSFLAVFAVRDQQSVTLDECYCKFLF